MTHWRFNTQRFAWLSLLIFATMGNGLWRLHEAHFQCVAASQPFFSCYYTKMTTLVLVGLTVMALITSYGAGWIVKWPAHLFGLPEQVSKD